MFKRFGTLAMALGCLALTSASTGCTKTVVSKTAATCKDGKKNGTETGVDCGGSCAACTGGSGGGTTTGCGSVTADGACSGSSIQVCDTTKNEISAFDCKDFTLSQQVGAACSTDADCTKLRADLKCDTASKQCVIIQQASDATCTTSTGSASPYCASPEGGLCLVDNGDSRIPLMCGNAGGPIQGLGCDIVTNSCVQTSSSCTPSSYKACTTVGDAAGCSAGENCVEGTDTNGQKVKVCAFTGACNGTQAVIDCTSWGQPYFLDCADAQVFGAATCGNAPKGLGCVNIAAGKYCDDQYFTCAAGLTCDTATNSCK